MATRDPRPALIALAALLLSSCAGYHVRKGGQAMNLLEYAKAEKHFTAALGHQRNRNVLLQAAEAERNQNKLEQAAAHYAEADGLAPLGGNEAFQFGRILMAMGDYAQAEPMLMRALKEQPEQQAMVELIGACQGYRSFYADSNRFQVILLPIPGMAAAYSATPFAGGILFAGQPAAASGKRDPWNNLPFSDLFVARPGADGTTWPATPLKGTVNGPFHESSAVVTRDGRTLYFTRSNYYGDHKLRKDEDNVSNVKLFRAESDGLGNWANIREFAFNSDSYSLGSPALSADNKTLYFVSDMPGGLGGKDIWYSTDLGSGWSKPRNMGPTINTRGDEMFPTVVGDALYFSSTGHNNMGGLDIFTTHRENDSWSEPENVGFPVNSTRDDFGFWLDSTGTSGFLSSDRSGADRIYRVSVNRPVFALEGTASDALTGKALPGASITLRNSRLGHDTVLTTDATGRYHATLAPNTAYEVLAAHPGMLVKSTPASTIGLGASTTLKADFPLDPIDPRKPMIIPNIYYDYDKWDIRPDAAAELGKIAKIFLDNPGLTFELGSHTDSRGADIYNLVLSDARARSAVDYLIRLGVPPERLVAKGYGETMPLNDCTNGVRCTEEEHQANRRTEIRVIGAASAAAQ